MMKALALSLLALVAGLRLAAPAPAATDPLRPLAFLEGTWEANARGEQGAEVKGTYTFVREMGGHVLARHSTSEGCRGPASFDCQHGDLLYVYAEPPNGTLKAIFFDNEGHVIHYAVSTPDAATAVFLSDAQAGPRFRLTYQLKGGIMSGKFQMLVPGQTDWKSYLDWTGGPRK